MEGSQDFKQAVEQWVIINHIEKIKLDNLIIKKKIGEGGQAKVYRGTFDKNQVAIKVMQNVDYKCFAHELVIIAYLDHPNIPKFYGILNEQNTLSLIFQYIDGKTLDEYQPGNFNEETKIRMILELASVLEYIHQNKFIHRDLKPENLMIDKTGKLYLIDFGIAKVCTNEDFTHTRAKGTVNYLAPECLEPCDETEEEQIISKITTKVDVWSFGCIVSWLFSGYIPWCDTYKDLEPVIQQVLMKKKPFSIPKNINNSVIVEVIKMATVIDPDARSDMTKIKAFMEKNLK